MPPSDVSLKRSRKVPEMVFFSSLRSWLRLTKPMMRLKHRELLRGCPASLLSRLYGTACFSRPSHFIVRTVSTFQSWRRTRHQRGHTAKKHLVRGNGCTTEQAVSWGEHRPAVRQAWV